MARTTLAVLFAAAVSTALNLYWGRNSPQRVLQILFVFWICGPFVALAIGARLAQKWSERTRAILRSVSWIVAGLSVTFYSYAALQPEIWKPAAFPWTVGPGIGWAIIATGALIAFLTRRTTTSS